MLNLNIVIMRKAFRVSLLCDAVLVRQIFRVKDDTTTKQQQNNNNNNFIVPIVKTELEWDYNKLIIICGTQLEKQKHK